jgi:hypothetical protein
MVKLGRSVRKVTHTENQLSPSSSVHLQSASHGKSVYPRRLLLLFFLNFNYIKVFKKINAVTFGRDPPHVTSDKKK